MGMAGVASRENKTGFCLRRKSIERRSPLLDGKIRAPNGKNDASNKKAISPIPMRHASGAGRAGSLNLRHARAPFEAEQ